MDYYEQLGILSNANESDIRTRLRIDFQAVAVLSNDAGRRSEEEARRQRLQTISDTLLNVNTRARYDAYLSSLRNDGNSKRIGFALPETVNSRMGEAAREISSAAYCSQCGRPVRVTAKFCSACGAAVEAITPPSPLESVSRHAGFGTVVSNDLGAAVSASVPAGYCNRCGKPLSTTGECTHCLLTLAMPQVVTSARSIFSGLSTYYQDEFQRIEESRESYKGKWNWAAFFFGALWGLTKGLWLSALLAIVGGLFTGGFIAVVYWFIFGVRGNYLYYCQVVKKRQLPL